MRRGGAAVKKLRPIYQIANHPNFAEVTRGVLCSTVSRVSVPVASRTAGSDMLAVGQARNPFGSRGTTSSGAFDISSPRPATGLGLEQAQG
jgi:hypothetical protein